MSILDFVWVFFIISAVLPALQRRRLDMRRLQFLRSWSGATSTG